MVSIYNNTLANNLKNLKKYIPRLKNSIQIQEIRIRQKLKSRIRPDTSLKNNRIKILKI